MTTNAIPWIMSLCLLVTGIQWYGIQKKTPLKERIAYWSIVSLCWILTILLLLYPGLPGPTDWVNAIFRPLGKVID